MLSEIRYRIRALFRRDRMEKELEEELQYHLERARAKFGESGLSREQAAREAQLALGGIEQVREECRQARGVSLIESCLQDLRYAFRVLQKSPTFTAVAVLSLALGIGANAAMFSLVDAVLLMDLPVHNPQELVAISSMEGDAVANESFSYPMYQDIRDGNQVFTGVLARGGTRVNVSYGGRTEHVRAELVTGNYYEVLGVRPWVGRMFTQDDDRLQGAHPVAVLSYGYWKERFGADPTIVGRSILLNGHPMTVLGVSPRGFYGTDLASDIDIRIPMMMATVFNPVPANRLQSRRHQWLTLMARRNPDVPISKAQASLAVLFHQIRLNEMQLLPPSTSSFDRKRFLARDIRLSPGSQGFQHAQPDLRQPLILLFGVTAAVVLILCANLANLLMARASARGHEAAVRLSLGATRGRLLRQWLTESVVLGTLGAAGGVLVAVWTQRSLVGFMPADLRTNLSAPLNWRVLAFLAGVSLLTSLAIGLVPALQSSRAAIAFAIRGDAPSLAAGGRIRGLRCALIMMQIALSLPLLVGAGLFLESLRNVRGIDAGFTRENVLIAQLNPSLNGYPQERIRNLYGELLTGIRAIPGVLAASLAVEAPISGGWDQLGIVVEGFVPRQGERMSINWNLISTDYFKTLRIPLVAGREFTAYDTLLTPKVAIINEAFARYFFGKTNPIGRRIGTGGAPDMEIVGVVKDAKYVDLREEQRRHFYSPVGQEPRLFDLTLQVRTAGDPAASADLVRSVAGRVDPDLPLYNVKTLESQISESIVRDRLVAWLTSLFGLVAVILAALGLYGVVAFSVARRTREIGVRIAMGARKGDILVLVLRQTGLLVIAGILAGICGAFAVTRLFASLLYETKPSDPAAFVAATLVLTAAAALASYLPARRAARTDPVIALRHE